MRRDAYFEDVDDISEEDGIDGVLDKYEGIVINAKDKKKKVLETRRRIERLMEQRRRRQFDEDYF